MRSDLKQAMCAQVVTKFERNSCGVYTTLALDDASITRLLSRACGPNPLVRIGSQQRHPGLGLSSLLPSIHPSVDPPAANGWLVYAYCMAYVSLHGCECAFDRATVRPPGSIGSPPSYSLQSK